MDDYALNKVKECLLNYKESIMFMTYYNDIISSEEIQIYSTQRGYLHTIIDSLSQLIKIKSPIRSFYGFQLSGRIFYNKRADKIIIDYNTLYSNKYVRCFYEKLIFQFPKELNIDGLRKMIANELLLEFSAPVHTYEDIKSPYQMAIELEDALFENITRNLQDAYYCKEGLKILFERIGNYVFHTILAKKLIASNYNLVNVKLFNLMSDRLTVSIALENNISHTHGTDYRYIALVDPTELLTLRL